MVYGNKVFSQNGGMIVEWWILHDNNHMRFDHSHGNRSIVTYDKNQNLQDFQGVLLLWIIHVISVLCLLYFCAHLFIVALWPPAGKGLTSWLSFVMSNCELVTFLLVPWVRCGT